MVELKSYECNDDDGDSFEDGEVCNDDDDTADLGPQWAAITQRRLLPPATPSHICTVSTTLISSQMMRMVLTMTKRCKFVPKIIEGMLDSLSRDNGASTWWVSTRSRICSMSTRLIRSKYNVSMISKLPGLWTWIEKRSITRQWLATTINRGDEALNFVQNDWTLNLEGEEKKPEQWVRNLRAARCALSISDPRS